MQKYTSLMQSIDLWFIILFGLILFVIGLYGLCSNKRNLIISLMSLEISLIGLSINFIAISLFYFTFIGFIFALLILVVAASESAILKLITLSFFSATHLTFEIRYLCSL
jgi:NADH:ubiquinone oxidoreductase subunit K